MNEFHGWLVIRENYGGDFIDRNNLRSILKDIEKKIEEFYFENCFVELKQMHQTVHLVVSGETKRKGIEVETIMNLFKYIATIAPGSYGLLYTRDEYDERSGEFKVYRIARGIFKEKEDVYLSPCIPMIDE